MSMIQRFKIENRRDGIKKLGGGGVSPPSLIYGVQRCFCCNVINGDEVLFSGGAILLHYCKVHDYDSTMTFQGYVL